MYLTSNTFPRMVRPNAVGASSLLGDRYGIFGATVVTCAIHPPMVAILEKWMLRLRGSDPRNARRSKSDLRVPGSLLRLRKVLKNTTENSNCYLMA
jgi:hypothetical protein